MRISGSGAMLDYETTRSTPWSPYSEEIRVLELPEKLTSIGGRTFGDCTALEKLILPEGVTTIGIGAFWGCKELRIVQMPASITEIRNLAFDECKKLIMFVQKDSYAHTYAVNKKITFLFGDAVMPELSVRGTYETSTYDESDSVEVYVPGLFNYNRDYSELVYTDNYRQVLTPYDTDRGIMLHVSLNGDYGYVTATEKITGATAKAEIKVWRVACLSSAYPDMVSLHVGETAKIRLGTTTPAHHDWVDVNFEYDSSMIDIAGGSQTKSGIDSFTFTALKPGKTTIKVSQSYKFPLSKDCTVTVEILPEDPKATTTTAVTTTSVSTTTTTTAATTTVVTTAATDAETLPATTETTPAGTVTQFEWYKDNWSFSNSPENFTDGYYYVSDADLERLFSRASNTEKKNMLNLMVWMNPYGQLYYEEWGGSCYGMACTSILASRGVYEPSQISPGSDSLYDISGPPPPNVRSFINYYYLLQKSDKVRQASAAANYQSETYKLERLLRDLESGEPELITFWWDEGGGHAVVGTGVEYGSWSYYDTRYSERILIYDNNAVSLNADFCLYCDPTTGKWCIPHYDLGSFNGSLGVCTNDLALINVYSYFDTSQSYQYEWNYGILDCGQIEGDVSVRRIKKNSGTWNSTADEDDEIRRFSSFGDLEEASSIMYSMPDQTAGYLMSVSKPQKMQTSMNYKDRLLIADTSAGTELNFYPDDHLTIKGSDMDYTAGIVLNEKSDFVTDWHTLSVSGSHTGEVRLEKADNGYVLWSTNLENVTANASNDVNSAAVTFSTKYQRVLLFEIDEKTIGVAVDTDNNGTYETKIAQSAEVSAALGDVNGDGAVNAKDAAKVLIAAAKIGTGNSTGLTAEKEAAADVNGDGTINAKDANIVLRYAAAVGTGQKVSIKDFI